MLSKRVSLFFVILLLFQTIASGVITPSLVSAEGDDQNVFRHVSVKDEAGQDVDKDELEGEVAVDVYIDWSTSDVAVETGHTDSVVLDDALQVSEEQSGTLTVDAENETIEVGTYDVTTDGTVTAVFNDEIEDNADASGTITVKASIEGEKEEIASEESNKDQSAENEEAAAETETLEEDETDSDVTENEELDEAGSSKKAETNGNVTEANEADETSDKETEEKETGVLAEEREPKAITESIIDEFKLLYEDGTEYKDGDFLEIGEDLRFELDWSLPNDHEYKNGDYFEFQLPNQLQVYNEVTGDLGEYGSYVVTTDGKVTFTFNENIEEKSNVKGEFWFDTELDEQKIGSTTEDMEIIFNDDVTEKITINVKPTGGQAIHKEGQPVDGNFNTEEIEWTVLVNTTREELKNAIIHDPILEGQELDIDSIVLQEVEVDLTGKVVEELGEVNVTNNSTIDELKLELGDTNKAYKLTFKTKITEDEKDKEGWLWYENTAYLNSDGQEEKQSGAGVSVERPESLVKTSSNFNEEYRSVEWEVKANFTEKQLKAGDTIVDEFTFKVGEDELNDVFEIIEDDIEILQVDSFDNNGNPDKTTSAKDLFDITIDGNKVTYTLKEDTNKI